MFAAGGAARALSSASAGPSGRRGAARETRDGARARRATRRRLSRVDDTSRDFRRRVIASDDPVAGSGASTTVVPAEEASVSEGATYALDLGDLASLVPRRRAGVDRVAKPVPDDATHGEHAAAFLSGNFQPLEEEITASAIVRTRRATPRAPSETESAETDHHRDPAVAADILLGPDASRGSSKGIVGPGIRRRLPPSRLGRRLGALRVHVLGGGDVRDARPGVRFPRVPRGEVRVRRPQPEVRRGALRKWGDGPGHETSARATGGTTGSRATDVYAAVDFSPEIDPSPGDGRRLRG